MKVSLITIVAGRHAHLRMQCLALTRSQRAVDLHVIVAMDDTEIARVARSVPLPMSQTIIADVQRVDGRLPLAGARNVGARIALQHGADILIFLDVDCIPSPTLVQRYLDAAHTASVSGLLSGPVAYLPPPPQQGYDLSDLSTITQGHPSRPTPKGDAVVVGADYRLFWTLSFAVDARTWQQLGGFCERYTGYGVEDTDFGQISAARGIPHTWVGGAWAYHQYHPTDNPPTRHLEDILRNASLFHERWGWWPALDWLTEFQRRGLAQYDPQSDKWAATPVSRGGIR